MQMSRSKKIACAFLFNTLLLLVLSGCTGQPVEAAPEGGLPGVKIPVGPIPGPAVEPNFPTNPFEGNPVALVEGRRLFVWYNCAGCHGGHGGGGMGPTLRDPVWRYGSADAQIFASIAEGRAMGMPAWGTRIPEDQIWKLVAYIKSMRTAQEPDPPQVPPAPLVKEAQK
jgi:cytochrome c oxidase cbb3-type subunit 3